MRTYVRMGGLQLSLDGADRLVHLLEERHEPVPLGEAARLLVRASRVPVAVARPLVDEVVRADARLAWRSADDIALAAWSETRLPLEQAVYCVVDLETTGHAAVARPHRRDRRRPHRGAGARRHLRAAGRPRRAAAARDQPPDRHRVARPARPRAGRAGARRVPGVRRRRGARGAQRALRHRLPGRRAAPARRHAPRLPGHRHRRAGPPRAGAGAAPPVAAQSSASASTPPCSRATARSPTHRRRRRSCSCCSGRAQERGARTVDDLLALGAPARRRLAARGHLAESAPRAPGTYVMRTRCGVPLYVGTATDLRVRVRSYFRAGRTAQDRPVDEVLPAVERIDYARSGSAFEARLDELALIAGLRPGANRQGARPERAAYLRLAADGVGRLDVGAPRAGRAARRPRAAAGATAPRAADALRLAYGLRSCRAAAPVEGGVRRGPPGALPRAVPRRGRARRARRGGGRRRGACCARAGRRRSPACASAARP